MAKKRKDKNIWIAEGLDWTVTDTNNPNGDTWIYRDTPPDILPNSRYAVVLGKDADFADLVAAANKSENIEDKIFHLECTDAEFDGIVRDVRQKLAELDAKIKEYEKE